MTQKKNAILLFLLVVTVLRLEAATPKAPYNLRSYDKINPVGTGDNPYFGWFVDDPDNNEIQSAYQILVASDKSLLEKNDGNMWDSRKVSSRKQNYIYYNGKSLLSGVKYFWKVRTWDKDGNVGPYSGVSEFSTGLFTNPDWAGAKWIKRDTKDKDDYTYFRKRFDVPDKTVKRAVVYISACHSYELYVNGKFAGKGFDHNYPQYATYNAWDITPFLSKNSGNIFACLTHWYGGGQGRAKGFRGLIMKAIIEYSDSSKNIICTDSTWKQIRAEKWVSGQPRRNGEGIGYIEMIDSRKFINGWNRYEFNDGSWNFAVETGEQPVYPWVSNLSPDLTRVIEKEIKPVSVKHMGDNKYVVDLGKIYPGSFKIKLDGGKEGDTVKVLGGFVLNPDGTVSEKINQHTKMNYYFILNGKETVFEPDVYLGMRYFQVDNSPCILNKENVGFVKRHYELDTDNAYFESSDTMLNAVWNVMVNSLVGGAQEGFVDTPTREKGTFLCDGWAQAVPDMSVMYDRTMNLKSLGDFLHSQDQYWPDGRMNAVYPNVDKARDIPDFTQVYLIWVWEYYMQTGNVEFLRENYSRLKKVADYVYMYRNENTGLIDNLKGGKGPYEYGIVDWPEDMRYGYDMDNDSRTVIDAYAYADLDIISKIANVLGETADKEIYGTRAANLKASINKYLVNKKGVYADGLKNPGKQSRHVSQHANVIPYALNIVQPENAKKVVKVIKKRKMGVGMVCLRWLPESLGEAEEGKHLFDLYTNTKWDGWAKNISEGGTFTWESWNAIDNNESLSHPWGASGILAMQNYFLGVKTLSPQNDMVRIKPLDFGKKLEYVKGSYLTDKGKIFVEWHRKNSKFTLIVIIPDNVIADVYIPKCGKRGKSVVYDNKKIEGADSNKYICLKNIGSGKHVFERQ